MRFDHYDAVTGTVFFRWQFGTEFRQEECNTFTAVGRLLLVGVKGQGEFFPVAKNSRLPGRAYIQGDIRYENHPDANACAHAIGFQSELRNLTTKVPLFIIEYLVFDSGQTVHLDERGHVVAPLSVRDAVEAA